MYYHASQIKALKKLTLHVSNHKESLVYLSEKRENILVYLSNAIEKHCKETNFLHDGIWTTWASYGFDKDGILRIEEYYPNATYDTYKGVSGYIYYVNDVSNLKKLEDIPYVYTSKEEVDVFDVEYIKDAYDAIMEEVKNNKIRILKYEDIDEKKKKWIYDTIVKEYETAVDQPDYKYFLLSKFDFLKENNI